MNKFEKYHEASNLTLSALKGSKAKRILLKLAKKYNFFTLHRLLGVPRLPFKANI